MGGLAHLRQPRARRRRALRAPAARGGRDLRGQDHLARVRLEGARRQPAHRHHAQSVEHQRDDGRLQRGRRRRGRRRAGPAPSGLGRCRLHPHPVVVLRPRRRQGQLRPRAAVAGLQQRLRHARRADDAHGGRRRAHAERDGRARRLGRAPGWTRRPPTTSASSTAACAGSASPSVRTSTRCASIPRSRASVAAAARAFESLGAKVEEVKTGFADTTRDDPPHLGRALHRQLRRVPRRVAEPDGPGARGLHGRGEAHHRRSSTS